MRKLLLAGLLLPFLAFTLIEWTPVQLDEKYTVAFPGEPKKATDENGTSLWTLEATDSNTVYLAMLIDFTKLGLDSSTMAVVLTQPEFFDEYQKGILGKLPNGKLVSSTTGEYKGYPVTNYKFTMKEGAVTYYSKNFFIGTRVYSLSYLQKKDQVESAERDRFFGSFNLR
ncbi:hypothetical protein [Flaviaesturariibacter amylovorans]|uniref:DUF1795 domain-containing protein n=1 Tax=Flaviaesturariibacter amylovorans TaxID=1084520 RepID=A0ABP8H9P2_9BACT